MFKYIKYFQLLYYFVIIVCIILIILRSMPHILCMENFNDISNINESQRFNIFNNISCRKFTFDLTTLTDKNKFYSTVSEWYTVFKNSSNMSIKIFALEHLCTLLADAEFLNEFSIANFEEEYTKYFSELKNTILADVNTVETLLSETLNKLSIK